MTQYLNNYVKNSDRFKQELKRILDKNFDFQTLIGAFDKDQRETKTELYRNLTLEELKEFNEALEAQDINEAVKELADVFVVGSVFGNLKLEEDYLDHVKDLYVTGLSKLTLDEEDWDGGVWEACTVQNLMEDSISMARSFTFDFLPYLEAVIDNNFEKLPLVSSVKDPNKDAQAIEKGSKGRYSGVGYSIIEDAEGNQRYKFVDGNGKLMKAVGYETIKFEIE